LNAGVATKCIFKRLLISNQWLSSETGNGGKKQVLMSGQNKG